MTDSHSSDRDGRGEGQLAVLLVASGLACVGIGTGALLAPTASANRLGYAFAAPNGKVEFVTFYGGFYVGIGSFLLSAAGHRSLRPGAVVFLALSGTAAVPARAYGILRFGVTDPVVYGLLFGEALFAAVGWVGWYWIADPSNAAIDGET